ncbi:(2Fe-2S)-binding protein [Aequoribacter fuscus]|uniref:2Fe-2S iron-sulfur cluster-binding protein n=1 Tax=Aequoribacter fuscus TaxID=2518989 RepID=UPI0005954B96|nr:(2Fe-2S)-binding protein [Aequoribacter fuscus]
MKPRFVRVDERHRDKISFTLNGTEIPAYDGDLLITAILCHQDKIRDSEFGDERRAGFCLMAACQDCILIDATGQTIRACSTFAENKQVYYSPPKGITWPTR